MRIFVFSLLLFTSSIFAKDFSLKERIRHASSGDYVVTEANKMVTVLCVRSIKDENALFEEISAPVQNLKNWPSSWEDWIRKRAPGHTSWAMFEVDLEKAEILECYSFSKSAWIRLSKGDSLIATLLNLPLESVSKDERKKIGPPPMDGEPDFRKIWNPPLVFQGQKVQDAQFDVYTASWPKDETELSDEDVLFYFDKNKQFPFPFWVQVDTSHATVALRTIDSGKKLPSVYRKMPRRVPEFVGSPLKTENSLKLNLKSPNYYKEFELFAIDVTGPKKQIFPILHSLKDGEGESKTVEIDFEELGQTLEPEHSYTWLIVPVGHSESYAETQKPFVWSPNK